MNQSVGFLFLGLIAGLIAIVFGILAVVNVLKLVAVRLEMIALEIKTLHGKLPRIELMHGEPPEEWKRRDQERPS